VSDSPLGDPGLPMPVRVRTRLDFARELTLLREHAGLTVRQVADKAGVQGTHSTIGDWFAGRGVPSTSSGDLLLRVLRACGVNDAGLVEQWQQAWRRVRRSPGPRTAGPEPYRGLASFQPTDAEWFFGRDRLTGQLIGRLADLCSSGGGVQLVVGASGSGKSSLLRAGVIPELRAGKIRGSADWPVLLFTPAPHPVNSLATNLAEFSGASASAIAAAIQANPGHRTEYARQAVLVVDQFEEVFTAGVDDEERRVFIAALCAGGLVLLGLRADFYAQALRYPQLVAAAQANQVAVGPMSEPELRATIAEPAHKANTDIEDGLVELLLTELAPRAGGTRDGAHDAGVLPLLSHALYATWHQGQGRRLTIANYREVGGIDGAVAASASKVYDQLTARQQELARRLFLSLVHIASDTADTRRRVSTAELLSACEAGEAQDMEDVLDCFIAQRLITADVDTVEISHEALLTAWPRLRAWLDNDRAGLVIARQLADAAVTWRREDGDSASLYRGTRLAAAKEWAETAGPSADLGSLARAFLDASIQRELEEQRTARRRIRRLRQLVAGLVVLFLITAAAGVVAIRSQQETREQRDSALSEKVANEAAALRTVNPALAAQLSLAAYRLTPTSAARGSLLSTFDTPYATLLIGHVGSLYSVVFSPDKRTMLTGGTDRTGRLWDVTDPHHPREVATLSGHADTVSSAVFTSDGHTLATGSFDKTARLWDLTDPKHPAEIAKLTGHTEGVWSVALSPDEHTLATASFDKTVRLWDITNPRQPAEIAKLTGHTDGIRSVSYSSDGRTLATGSSDRTVRLWDVTNPRQPAEIGVLTDHTDRVLSVVFSPDGRTLASGSFDATTRLWDTTNPRKARLLSTLSGHKNGVDAMMFSPDNHTLATGSYDGTVKIWDITEPDRPAATLTGHTDTVYAVAFSPDGRTLGSVGRDNNIRLWDVHNPIMATGATSVSVSPDGRTLATGGYRKAWLWDIADPLRPSKIAILTGHTDVVYPVFSPDGHTLATPSLDGTTKLWNVTDPRHPVEVATLTGHTGNVFAAAFSPDGRVLATAGTDNTARLWDVSDPSHPSEITTLTDYTSRVLSVAFSPDGHMLATSSNRIARLWDVTNPRQPRDLGVLTGHGGDVLSVAFSPNGKTLATGSNDDTARLWDINTARETATLTGHSGDVYSIAFSPDGNTLATAGYDSTARLWNVTDPGHPTEIATLTGHTDDVVSVTFSPLGTILATGGMDATARLWDTDVDRIAARVCDIAYPAITPAEWSQHFPGLDYRPPCP
jgi:WD40 repeat protein/transcriptional regulator with XRE-family HTH domain